jgi:hypothetical protein
MTPASSAPSFLPPKPMNDIQGEVFIRRPPAVVADYVTTPATWADWYPLTRSVEGDVSRPPAPGQEWREHVTILFLPFVFTWRTILDERPRRYRYEGTSNVGGHATITYEWTAEADGTRWARTLVYTQDHLWTRLMDWLILRALIRRASAQALLNARDRLEKPEA